MFDLEFFTIIPILHLSLVASIMVNLKLSKHVETHHRHDGFSTQPCRSNIKWGETRNDDKLLVTVHTITTYRACISQLTLSSKHMFCSELNNHDRANRQS